MNNIPAAGVDVSKRFSDLCILTQENEVFARTKICHDLTSMACALDLLLQGGAAVRSASCFDFSKMPGMG